jgi:hypothetical protein
MEKPYAGAGLLADTDVSLSILNQDYASESWSLTLDYNALVIPRSDRLFLFTVKEEGGAVEFIQGLIQAQESHDRLADSAFQLPTPRETIRGVPRVVVIDRIGSAVVDDYRDAKPI